MLRPAVVVIRKQKTPGLASQSRAIIKSEANFFAGLHRLWVIFLQVWLWDLLRPGVKTGYQVRPQSLGPTLMWYSPTETSTARTMIRFAAEWAKSYWVYSQADLVPVFVDFGAGAGKVALMAAESRKFRVSVAFEIDDELCRQAETNLVAMEGRLSKSDCETRVFAGDVTHRSDVLELKKQIETLTSGQNFMLFAYNKNSYGPQVLGASIDILTEVFGEYIYLYQNPVHRSMFEPRGLLEHRLILDPKLRKNRDWLIAAKAHE